jgi:hypothetical protein
VHAPTSALIPEPTTWASLDSDVQLLCFRCRHSTRSRLGCWSDVEPESRSSVCRWHIPINYLLRTLAQTRRQLEASDARGLELSGCVVVE